MHSCTFFCVYAGLVDFCRKLCYFDVKINAQLTTVSYSVLGIGAQMLKYRPNINPIKSIRLEAYQMSTMKKRIPMFLLALAMMVAMALPTFADNGNISTFASTNVWRFYRAYSTNFVAGVKGAISDGAPVILAEKADNYNQHFMAKYARDGSLRIFCRSGYQSAKPEQSYTLNVYRSGNYPCTMLRGTNDNRLDSEIDFNTINASNFRIKLVKRNLYLTQNALNNQLTWTTYSEDGTKAWAEVSVR